MAAARPEGLPPAPVHTVALECHGFALLISCTMESTLCSCLSTAILVCMLEFSGSCQGLRCQYRPLIHWCHRRLYADAAQQSIADKGYADRTKGW